MTLSERFAKLRRTNSFLYWFIIIITAGTIFLVIPVIALIATLATYIFGFVLPKKRIEAERIEAIWTKAKENRLTKSQIKKFNELKNKIDRKEKLSESEGKEYEILMNMIFTEYTRLIEIEGTIKEQVEMLPPIPGAELELDFPGELELEIPKRRGGKNKRRKVKRKT